NVFGVYTLQAWGRENLSVDENGDMPVELDRFIELIESKERQEVRLNHPPDVLHIEERLRTVSAVDPHPCARMSEGAILEVIPDRTESFSFLLEFPFGGSPEMFAARFRRDTVGDL